MHAIAPRHARKLADAVAMVRREHVEHLTAQTVAGSVSLLDAVRAQRAEPVDLHLMLALWRTGSPQCRDAALELADRDRARALSPVRNLAELA